MTAASQKESSSRKMSTAPRGNKITVGLYLDQDVVERAKLWHLNFSRVMESSLSSILDFLEPASTPKEK